LWGKIFIGRDYFDREEMRLLKCEGCMDRAFRFGFQNIWIWLGFLTHLVAGVINLSRHGHVEVSEDKRKGYWPVIGNLKTSMSIDKPDMNYLIGYYVFMIVFYYLALSWIVWGLWFLVDLARDPYWCKRGDVGWRRFLRSRAD
jgi:hypothetical protein